MTTDGRLSDAIEHLQNTLDVCRVAGMELCRIPVKSLSCVVDAIGDMQRQVSELTEKITAPSGFETDITFYCKECGEEAIRCEGCRKWICGDCNEKHGGQQWFCVDCDEHAPRQEDET